MAWFLSIFIFGLLGSPLVIGHQTPVVCTLPQPFTAFGSRIGPSGYSSELISKNAACNPQGTSLEPKNWYKGVPVRGNCNGQLARGTAIAMFEAWETKFNVGDIRRRHAALLVTCGPNKIVAIEQTVPKGQQTQIFPFVGGSGLIDGSKYYVVNVDVGGAGGGGGSGGQGPTRSVSIKPKGPTGLAQGLQIPKERFTYFWKEGDIFSQWYPSTFTGIPLFSENTQFFQTYTFNHAEKWMMLCKALLFDDLVTAQKILAEPSPKGVKDLGAQVKPYDNGIWSTHSIDVLYAGNYLKFTQNPGLRSALEGTKGTTLVEASPFDKIYGIGWESKDYQAKYRAKWEGKNLLGQTLTRLRQDLTGVL